MTVRPPAGPTALASRGVRLLAVAVVALAAAGAGTITGSARLIGLTVVAVALVTAAVAAGRKGLRGTASSAVVAAALVGLLVAEEALQPSGRAIDLLLGGAGTVFLLLAYALRERRLAVLGALQWAVVVARPLPGGASFQHCVVLPDVAIGVPRLLPLLGLSLAGIALGTWHRRTGQHAAVGRGLESVGAIGTMFVLVALAVELPGHPLLCGPGDAMDPGWGVLAVLVGMTMVVYGLAGRDPLWATAGVTGVAAVGLAGTALTAAPWWALAALAPLLAGLLLAERAGVRWPTAPGYGRARPATGDLQAIRRRLRPRAGAPADDTEPGSNA